MIIRRASPSRSTCPDLRLLAFVDVSPHKATNLGRFSNDRLHSWLCAEKRRREGLTVVRHAGLLLAFGVMSDHAKQILVDAFGRVRELVIDLTDGLTDEIASYRPDPEANSIAWLIWHLSRVQDDHVADRGAG